MYINFTFMVTFVYIHVYASSSRWMVAGVGDSLKGNQSYEHPESPIAGEVLSAQVVSFEKIKLTNNEAPAPGQVRTQYI